MPEPDASEYAAWVKGESPSPSGRHGTAVTRVYGLIIMAINVICIVLTIAAMIFVLRKAHPPAKELGWIVLMQAIGIGINVLFYRLGKGLRAGERMAVHGILWVSLLWVCLAPLSAWVSGHISKPWMQSLCLGIVLGVLIFYVPPVVSAYRHWDRFH